jgi:hypothetical protein
MRSSISPWLRTSGPPIWISLPVEAAIAGRLHEVSQRVVDRDRLRSVLQPRRSDHRRKSLHEVTQRPIGLALRTDHHAGAEIGQRGTVLGQRKGRLVAAAQVLGVRAIAEPAQVDDPLDLFLSGHLRERRRGCSLARHEVPAPAPSHRVDQVVRDVDPSARAPQALGPQDVALMQRQPALFELASTGSGAIPDHATHLPTSLRQR